MIEEISRLKNFARIRRPGGCRMLSEGADCNCPLCDIDRLQQTIDEQAKEIAKQREQLESPTTDMREICRRLGFDPSNHHNAKLCPYCTDPRPAA